jgi:hypothetical protein
MHNSAIHDARANAVPSQIKYADERRARQARFEGHTIEAPPIAPVDKTLRGPPSAINPLPKPAAVVEAAPPPKKPWFWIEFEIEKELRVETIQRVVLARYPKVTRRDLLSARRTKDVVLPRHIAVYLTKMLTVKSLPQIGRAFGRDHTTVLFSINKIARLIEADDELADDIETMMDILKAKRAA